MKKKIKVKSKLNLRILASIFLTVLLIILIFAAIDYLIHSLSKEYSVPSDYFRNKIIFGTIIGFITYRLIRNQKPLYISIIFSCAVSILLQIRYFLEGYSLDFVLLFLLIHFLILFPVSIIAFRLLEIKTI